jgi:hypothetical protein
MTKPPYFLLLTATLLFCCQFDNISASQHRRDFSPSFRYIAARRNRESEIAGRFAAPALTLHFHGNAIKGER